MDPLVERIVQTIAEAIRPEKIILLGSRAYGTADADSDVDLVVVCSGSETKREVELRIRRLFARPDFSMDVLVMTPDELETQKHIANSLAREVSERGVVCYSSRQTEAAHRSWVKPHRAGRMPALRAGLRSA